MAVPPGPLRVTVANRSAVFNPGATVVIGRGSDAAIVLSHDRVSRAHLEISFDPDSGWVAIDSSANGTFIDGRRISRVQLRGALTLMLGGATDGEAVHCAVEAAVGAGVAAGGEVLAAAGAGGGAGQAPGGGVAAAPAAGRAPLNPSLGQFSMVYEPVKRTRIGRAADNDIVVSDLLASRYHAALTADGRGGWSIEDLGSHNGTYVNGHAITRRTPVADGAVISVGHHLFYLSRGAVEEYLDDGRVNLTALQLRVMAGGQRLLDDVSFSLERCSLLAVLGPTGAGKSTVMRVLTGGQAPAAGTVLYNGRNLYAAYDELRYRIGYVPQDDILHGQLPVRQALRYAAKLRFPPDVSALERNQRVDEVMAELGLTARADLMVNKLSGGQRKRTSVALELLTRPSLLSLDEPTSGLDPGYERQVMTVLRDLTRAGRTVITVTHNTESLDLCDRLLFLAPGGQVAYYGPPAEAREFFGTEHYPEVFTYLEESRSGVAKQVFAGSPQAHKYLDTPMRAAVAQAPPAAPAAASARRAARVPSATRQLPTLIGRYSTIIFSDLRNTLLLLIQAPVLGLLMLTALGRDGLAPGGQGSAGGSTVLLALILGATYLGAGNAVREIVKERAILVRERAAGLSAGAYLFSKAFVLGVLTVVQAVILVLLGTARQGGPAAGAVFGSGRFELIVVASLAGLAAMALGLVISAMVGHPDKALTILPVVLLAQFLLSGVFFSVDSPVLKPLSYVTSARWGFAAAASTSDLKALQGRRCAGDPAVTAAGVPVPGRVVPASDPVCDPLRRHTSGTWTLDMSVLAVLTVVPLAAAWVWVRRTGRPRRQ